MHYRIRQYQKEDRDQVLRLHFEGLEQMGVDIDFSRIDAMLLDHTGLDSDLNDIEANYLMHGDFIVGCSWNRILAMGAVRKTDDQTAEIKRMRVAKEYQNTGLGSDILERLIDKAKMLGCSRLFLDTLESNDQARKFYEHHGFHHYDSGAYFNQNIVFYERYI